jgi:glycosyltransferase involved in cell wall biosynthesis
MEAMASGLPCVVSLIRGNVDLIDDPQCLVKPNDSDGFADAIRKAMNDVAWRTSVGLRNRQEIKGFSLDHVRKEMQKIYRDTLG